MCRPTPIYTSLYVNTFSIFFFFFVDPVINVDQEAPRAAGNQARPQATTLFPADLQILFSAIRGANNVRSSYMYI